MDRIWVRLRRRVLGQCFILLAAAGALDWYLTGTGLAFGFFTGEIIGFSYLFIMGRRISNSAHCEAAAAVRNMQVGWIVRLVLILGCLIAVVQISEPLFWSVVAGFFLTECVVIANAVALMVEKDSDHT